MPWSAGRRSRPAPVIPAPDPPASRSPPRTHALSVIRSTASLQTWAHPPDSSADASATVDRMRDPSENHLRDIPPPRPWDRQRSTAESVRDRDDSFHAASPPPISAEESAMTDPRLKDTEELYSAATAPPAWAEQFETDTADSAAVLLKRSARAPPLPDAEEQLTRAPAVFCNLLQEHGGGSSVE